MAATVEATATLAGDSTAQTISLLLLAIAPWNVRKTFNDESISEMTESIKRHGIITPLTVRPLDADGKLDTTGNPEVYEIVGGHRRYKAACRAELQEVPCIVRQLTDDEAREIGMVDNLQRENLPPLEEARGFAELMEARGATAETVAAKVGKSASYVARRLALLDAITPVQDALAAGAIEVGHALELARLDSAQQQKMLHWLNVGYDPNADAVERARQNSERRASEWNAQHGNASDFDDSDLDDDEEMEFDEDDEGQVEDDRDDSEDDPDSPEGSGARETSGPKWYATPKTVAALKHEIGRTMFRVLANAPWPLEDEIPPIACTECPKRSSNASLLFPDAAHDLCTDADCYEGKQRAWVRYSLEQAEKAGKNLVLAGHDSWYGGDEKVKGVVPKFSYRVVEDGKPCEFVENAIMYDGPNRGTLLQICRTENCPVHDPARGLRGSTAKPKSPEEIAKEKEKQKAERRKVFDAVKVQKRYRGALLDAIATAPVPDSQIDAMLTEACAKLIRGLYGPHEKRYAAALGWNENLFAYSAKASLEKHLASLSRVEQLRAALIAIHFSDLQVHEHGATRKDYRPNHFEAIAKAIGVDAKPLWEAAQSILKPKPDKKAKAEPKAEIATATKGKKPKAAAKPAPKSKPTPKPKATAKKTTTKKAAKAAK